MVFYISSRSNEDHPTLIEPEPAASPMAFGNYPHPTNCGVISAVHDGRHWSQMNDLLIQFVYDLSRIQRRFRLMTL